MESLDFFTPVLAKEMFFQEHLLGLRGSLYHQRSASPRAVCSQQPQYRQNGKTENYSSALAEILADCCHAGLESLLTPRALN